MASYISKTIRQTVYERAKYCCEYCQTAQRLVAWLEIDHILPVSLDGATHLDNLCASCHACNNFKNNAIEALDPQTNMMSILFNPRTHKWSEHFQWDATKTLLLGLTPIGRATVEQLKINRVEAVSARQLWALAGWHPPIFDE